MGAAAPAPMTPLQPPLVETLTELLKILVHTQSVTR